MRTGLDLGHSDGRVHHLAQETAGECAHGGLSSAVYATARVRFPSRDRPDVDDVAHVAGLEVCRGGSFSAPCRGGPREKEGEVGIPARGKVRTDGPIMRSWVREMRPRTFVAN